VYSKIYRKRILIEMIKKEKILIKKKTILYTSKMSITEEKKR